MRATIPGKDCIFSAWSDWSACTCTGLQERHRSIQQHYLGDGTPCEGAKTETRSCSPDCVKEPVDCKLSEWSVWSTCSAECGGGQMFRTREVTVDPENGGKLCEGARHLGSRCDSSRFEVVLGCGRSFLLLGLSASHLALSGFSLRIRIHFMVMPRQVI